jgi:hypothetical protein
LPRIQIAALHAEGNDRLIRLDDAEMRRALGVDHRPAQLGDNIQAVRYEPRPSWLCSCSAEVPLECVAIKNAAQNHVVSGSLLACMIVPAVTEV